MCLCVCVCVCVPASVAGNRWNDARCDNIIQTLAKTFIDLSIYLSLSFCLSMILSVCYRFIHDICRNNELFIVEQRNISDRQHGKISVGKSGIRNYTPPQAHTRLHTRSQYNTHTCIHPTRHVHTHSSFWETAVTRFKSYVNEAPCCTILLPNHRKLHHSFSGPRNWPIIIRGNILKIHMEEKMEKNITYRHTLKFPHRRQWREVDVVLCVYSCWAGQRI